MPTAYLLAILRKLTQTTRRIEPAMNVRRRAVEATIAFYRQEEPGAGWAASLWSM